MNQMDDFLLTKIVATLGPATEDAKVVEQLVQEGVRVFRINFSHGNFKDHEDCLRCVRRVSKNTGIPVAVLGDLSGPKIRLGKVVAGGVDLAVGQIIEFSEETVIAVKPKRASDPVVFSTTYTPFIREVEPGQRVLLDDGFVRLTCVDKKNGRLICTVIDGGVVTSNKGVNLPDTELSVPALTAKDIKCVEFAVAQGFDYLALSFVRTGDCVRQLKQELVRLGARPEGDLLDNASPLQFSAIEIESEDIIPIISKIEKPQAIENLESILRETDAVMVARGDLGVEMDLAEVAVLQKRIIRQCQDYGIPVIVATQMLQSMINSPTPTRAEVSDVANAIFDGADAVMLSGETAIGKYPLEAVRMMKRIALKTNAYIREQGLVAPVAHKALENRRRAAALTHGVRTIAQDMAVKLLAVWAQFGGGAVYLSQQRVPFPILCCSPSDAVLRRTALLYGVIPIPMEQPASSHAFLEGLDRLLLDQNWAQESDPIVVVLGEPITQVGLTNQICIHYVGETLAAVKEKYEG